MPATPDKNDVMAQITAAWETAKVQLAELREAVERNAKLTAAKVTNDGARREKDVAFRELGEAVWDQVKKGKLVLPGTLSKAQKAVEEVERKLEAQASEIFRAAGGRRRGRHPVERKGHSGEQILGVRSEEAVEDAPHLTSGPSPQVAVSLGAIAQLGERLNGIQEVSGSIPLSSTEAPRSAGGFFVSRWPGAKRGSAGTASSVQTQAPGRPLRGERVAADRGLALASLRGPTSPCPTTPHFQSKVSP